MYHLRFISRFGMIVLMVGATIHLFGCTTVVGKGDVSRFQGECSEGEECSLYCCIDKDKGGGQCRLKSPAIEGTSCACPVTTIVGLRYAGGNVCKGAGSKSSAKSEAPSTPVRDYKPVDYKKWVSGLYADEFIGKAVIVDGYIQKSTVGKTSMMGLLGRVGSDIDFHVLEYSHDQIRENAQKRGANSYSSAMEMVHSMIPVTAPKSMRDQIFATNNGQKVRIYGVVVNPFASISTIRVKAERIETVQ